MKKNNIIIYISITVFLLSSILILWLLIGNNTKDYWWKKVLHRTNSDLEEKIKSKYSEEDIKNVSADLEIWNHMNITMEEILTYWTDNGEILWFFKEEWYNILYLYTCINKNKILFECPQEWFIDFVEQFTSTWTITL